MVHNPDAHIFVTQIFNQCFNEFINTNLEKKRIGTEFGGTQEFGLYKYGQYYYQAKDLQELRDYLLRQKRISNSILKEAIHTIAEIFVATNNNDRFKKDIQGFINLIREDHDFDLKPVFEAALKAIKSKPKPTSKPTVKSEPKPTHPPIKPPVEVIEDEPEEQPEPVKPEPPINHPPIELPEEPNEPEEPPQPRACPQCKNSENVNEIHLRKGKDESYSCFKCKKCRITFDRKGKILYRDEEPKEPNKKKSRWLVWFGVVLICLLISVGVIVFLVLSKTKSEVIDTQNKTRTVYENVTLSSKISFQAYVDNIADFDQQEITTKCFLRRYIEGTGTSGKYIQAVEDDAGKRFILANPQTQYQSLFPKNGISTSVYEVTGILQKKYNGINIDISDIRESQRDAAGIKQVEKIQTYTEESKREVISPKYPMIRAFVLTLFGQPVTCEDGTLVNKCSATKSLYCGYSGLYKNPVECGCPEGQRLFKKECIQIVKCSDNTLSPECSITKPKQCVNGKLIDDADLCGCPDDYRKSGKSCNKIMRCSDGTEYGKCTSNKPKYCDEGVIVNMASECGCPWSQYEDGATCIAKTRAIEKAILKYTNEERTNAGLRPLKWDDALASIARGHSEDMAENDFFSHDNLQGEDPSARAARAGYSAMKPLGGGSYAVGIAENIGKMPTGNVEGVGYVSDTPDAVAKAQVQSWMDSPGHRQNILTATYTNLGVGVGEDGIYYISTQNFW